MYLINDKRAAVRALQRMLGVTENGRLDRATRAAAEKITRMPLPEKIGYTEFLKIKENFQAKKEAAFVRRRLGEWKFGDAPREYTTSQMTEINSLFSTMITLYRIDAYPPRGGYYTEDTKRAVNVLRNMLLLPEGDIDTGLLYRVIMNLELSGKENKYPL